MIPDEAMLAALKRLRSELPGLCAPPDGLFYANDRAGIERYAQVQGRIEDRINQWMEALEI